MPQTSDLVQHIQMVPPNKFGITQIFYRGDRMTDAELDAFFNNPRFYAMMEAVDEKMRLEALKPVREADLVPIGLN